ncbi:hypothetical protein ACFQX7_02145 [Luedemannella flava]
MAESIVGIVEPTVMRWNMLAGLREHECEQRNLRGVSAWLDA